RVYEEADEEAALAQTVNRLLHEVEVRGGVQAAFGRNLVWALGDERDGVGSRVRGDGNHLVCGGHLDVEVCGDRAPERVYVLVLYVTAVAAQVHRDAVRARLLAHHRSRHHARLRRAPRLTHGRH